MSRETVPIILDVNEPIEGCQECINYWIGIWRRGIKLVFYLTNSEEIQLKS